MPGKIIVSGVGCCLVDVLYNGISFESGIIRPYLSKSRGDGGLNPGHLVFTEEFEKFCGDSLDEVLNRITGGLNYDKINIGGPSIVSLINLAQLTYNKNIEIRFFGRGGKDNIGRYLISSLRKTSVVLTDYKLIENQTPSTIVFSDPSFDNGHGERMFINSIGAAWDYGPGELDNKFFDADIAVFGGTALVPQIHDNLTSLLKKAKSKGCITIVNTVFDFRNEKANPSLKWPLGESDESYKFIDLLIADQEEAFRLSGESDHLAATRFFIDNKVSSVIITNGSKNISLYSDGRFFHQYGLNEMPVSQKIVNDLGSFTGGDTTGCGDNFVGGVIASVVSQLRNGSAKPDLREACCWGIVSGGYACFYMGGTYLEKKDGEKRTKMEPYYEDYKKQIGN